MRAAPTGLLILPALLAVGCSTLSYYSHTMRGGLEVLRGRRPIESMLDDPAVSADLKQRLELILEIRSFASRELSLPDNESYRRYKDLARDYASWIVVATPELSLAPIEWCFPVAGCVSYRGYFSRSRAERFAEKWRSRGHDVDVGGVRAYSTLGWFADPVLSTFVDLSEPDLVGLIVHELSHQLLYVPGDTVFNESFATTVELIGVRRWLEWRGEKSSWAEYLDAKRRERAIFELVEAYRPRLAEVYQGEGSDDWKRSRKAELFAALRADYRQLSSDWDDDRYDAWMGEDLNNARLASMTAYFELVPALCELFARCRRELDCFYRECEKLSSLEPHERRKALESAVGAEAGSGDEACGRLPVDPPGDEAPEAFGGRRCR